LLINLFQIESYDLDGEELCDYSVDSSEQIIINPLPTATILGDMNVCQNDGEPTITFTGANGTAPYTFTYSINGGIAQTVTSTGNTATVQAPTNLAGSLGIIRLLVMMKTLLISSQTTHQEVTMSSCLQKVMKDVLIQLLQISLLIIL